MARILWHGIGPWHKTGYGVLTDEFTRRLRDLGHEVAIAVMGEKTAGKHPFNHPDAATAKATGMWDGMRIFGPGPREFALPFQHEISAAFGGADPDLVIVLKDAWVLSPSAYDRYRTLVWLFFDCEPMGAPDVEFFRRSTAIPVCASQWGLSQARAAGLTRALYVPAGIDTELWTPGDREAARGLLGLPQDHFIAGINAANIGPRKGWGEQFSAFAQFRARHPKSLLLVHSSPEHPEGMNLRDLAARLDITDAVMYGSRANMAPAQMVNWYRSLDVLLAASYGEGFGLPITEAQSCGIPVIGTRCSAITEKILAGTGWRVGGQPWWNYHHAAWWTIPNVREIVLALGKAHKRACMPPDVIRYHAQGWDAGHVTREYWKPAIDQMTAG